MSEIYIINSLYRSHMFILTDEIQTKAKKWEAGYTTKVLYWFGHFKRERYKQKITTCGRRDPC